MRAWLVLLLVPLAGCFEEPVHLTQCKGAEDVTLFLDTDLRLRSEAPPAGFVQVDGASGAFVVEPPAPWVSTALAQALALEGDVTIELWARAAGPAPVVDSGDPSQGYHWFNQFGSDLALLPEGAVQYADAVPAQGGVQHLEQVIPLPAGGFRIEEGQEVRVQLTSLAAPGHEVLVGGSTPSQVRFTARCVAQERWVEVSHEEHAVEVPGNQGLLSGLVPAQEGVNQQTVAFTLEPETQRLVVRLQQMGQGPVKDDMDLVLLDEAGGVVWRGGSPAADESMAMWQPNLQLLAPPGAYAVRVDSYSGTDYAGTLTITQERAA